MTNTELVAPRIEPELPPSYDPNVHLDAQDPGDYQVGLFSGISVAPNHTNASSSEYVVRFGFHALKGRPKRYAISVSGPWRITFEWRAGDAERVDLEQYH